MRDGKTKEFPLFEEESRFTDDTAVTVAVAESPARLVKCGGRAGPCGAGWFHAEVGKEIPQCRIRCTVLLLAQGEGSGALWKLHDHPEGLKGAEAIAGAIFLARTGHSKQEIRNYAAGLGYHSPGPVPRYG